MEDYIDCDVCKHFSIGHCYECDIGYCDWWDEYVFGSNTGIPSLEGEPCPNFVRID